MSDPHLSVRLDKIHGLWPYTHWVSGTGNQCIRGKIFHVHVYTYMYMYDVYRSAKGERSSNVYEYSAHARRVPGLTHEISLKSNLLT